MRKWDDLSEPVVYICTDSSGILALHDADEVPREANGTHPTPTSFEKNETRSDGSIHRFDWTENACASE